MSIVFSEDLDGLNYDVKGDYFTYAKGDCVTFNRLARVKGMLLKNKGHKRK